MADNDFEIDIHIDDPSSNVLAPPVAQPRSQTTGSNTPTPSSPREPTTSSNLFENWAEDLFGPAFSKSLQETVGGKFVDFIESVFGIELEKSVVGAVSSLFGKGEDPLEQPVGESALVPDDDEPPPQGSGNIDDLIDQLLGNLPQPTSQSGNPPQAPPPTPGGSVAAPPSGSGGGASTPIIPSGGSPTGGGSGVPPQAPTLPVGGAGGAGAAGGAAGAGAAGGGAGAAVAAGGVAGPVGLAIAAALVVAIGGTVIAFKTLMGVIHRVDDEMERLINVQKQFSGPVALAEALNQVKEIESQIRRANATEGDLSQIASLRGDINATLTDMYTEILKPMLPLVKDGAEAILNLLRVVEPLVKIVGKFDPEVTKMILRVLLTISGFGSIPAIIDLLSLIEKNTSKDEEEAMDKFADQLKDFLNTQPPQEMPELNRIRKAPRGVMR